MDFSGLRERWWIPWQLEPFAHILRYLWLIERARALNALEPVEHGWQSGPLDIRTFAVVQFGHLGDMLHTGPMLRAARKTWPNAQITLITGTWNQSVAERIGCLDRVLYLVPKWEAYARNRLGDCLSWRDEWNFFLGLRKEKFDLVVDATAGSLPTLFCLLMLRPALGIGPELFPPRAFPTPPSWYRSVPYASHVYEARRLLHLLSGLGVTDADETLQFAVTAADRQAAQKLLAQRDCGADAGYLVFAPGAGWPGKMWPAERFAELARRVIDATPLCVAAVGTAQERSLCERVVSALGRRGANLAGQTSVGELAALIAGARAVVTNDSGPYHWAVAMDVPTVLLFGPGFPTKWAKPRTNQRVLRHEVGCRCYPWHPRASCDYENACMRVISTDEVWNALRDLLNEYSVGQRSHTHL